MLHYSPSLTVKSWRGAACSAWRRRRRLWKPQAAPLQSLPIPPGPCAVNPPGSLCYTVRRAPSLALFGASFCRDSSSHGGRLMTINKRESRRLILQLLNSCNSGFFRHWFALRKAIYGQSWTSPAKMSSRAQASLRNEKDRSCRNRPRIAPVTL